MVSRDLGVIKVGWITLHETKLPSVDSYMMNQVCGWSDWGFSFSALIGSAGGIICFLGQGHFLCFRMHGVAEVIPVKCQWVDGMG